MVFLTGMPPRRPFSWSSASCTGARASGNDVTGFGVRCDPGLQRGVFLARFLGHRAHGLEFLREAGCDQIQGFLVSRPLPDDRLDAWLADEPYDLLDYAVPGGSLLDPVQVAFLTQRFQADLPWSLGFVVSIQRLRGVSITLSSTTKQVRLPL